MVPELWHSEFWAVQTTIRERASSVYPFLFYLEKQIGHEALTQFTESVDIDSEFFLDFDNLINFQVIVDLMNWFMRDPGFLLPYLWNKWVWVSEVYNGDT